LLDKVTIAKYDNYTIVDKVIDGSDAVISSKRTHFSKRTHSTKVMDGSEIYINRRIVDDFNILDKNDIHIRLMYQLPNNFINYYGEKE
jgi:hypothetical protein